jgi:hypothetical protein
MQSHISRLHADQTAPPPSPALKPFLAAFSIPVEREARERLVSLVYLVYLVCLVELD